MINFLKNHPFAVKSYFKHSLVITYALPIAVIRAQLPPCFEPDTFNNEYGFAAVAMVQTNSLRPSVFPAFLGNDFFLTGYRIFVRYTTSEGKRLRGLYILKSDTDKRLMKMLGNFFTHYNYNLTDIHFIKDGPSLVVLSNHSKISVKAQVNVNADLPKGSPFENWKEARRFAGPLPFTFTFLEKDKEVLIVEGQRENWSPQPVEVLDAQFGFMENQFKGEYFMANAFYVENIPYQWKKGKLDKWIR
jgi:uncharacterized protein YqjF (DUF2071 family)